MFYAVLQWLKQTTNRVLTHKRYPISHPHGRAMGCPSCGFGKKWPPHNGSTLHYDLGDGRSHYLQGNKMFALESFSLHDHRDCYHIIIGIKPCHQKLVLSIRPRESVWGGGISPRPNGLGKIPYRKFLVTGLNPLNQIDNDGEIIRAVWPVSLGWCNTMNILIS